MLYKSPGLNRGTDIKFRQETGTDKGEGNVTPSQNAVPANANGYSVSGISNSPCCSGNIASYNISDTFCLKCTCYLVIYRYFIATQF